jgi:SET domain-containing protein
MIIETRTETNAKFKVKAKRGSAGLGLFALEPIPAGSKIIEYIGIVRSASNDLSNKYIFSVNSKIDIDGSPRYNIARYINHSCLPNAESQIKKGHVWITAIKDIAPGEEITYDYGTEYVDQLIRPHGCKCADCKTVEITAR